MDHPKIPFKAVLFSGLLMLVHSAVQGQTVKAPGIRTEPKITAIQEHRVYAMSLIHQRLYQFKNSTTIDMAVCLPELTDYLSDSYAAKQRIVFCIHIDYIKLDISQDFDWTNCQRSIDERNEICIPGFGIRRDLYFDETKKPNSTIFN